MKATPVLIAAALAFPMAGPAAPLEWTFEVTGGSPDRLVWQTEPGIAYNLWFSATLSDPFVHVDGFPKDGIGEPMEHPFHPDAKGFFRIDSAPQGFGFIPKGRFEMGDSFDEGERSESPVHTVFVSAFYMASDEVTVELWNEVRAWSRENGYNDLHVGKGKQSDHAVHSIIWWDAMKWCNARSEMEGRAPCYFKDSAKTEVYRNGGRFKTKNEHVDWTADGYRLPTEAEWEKAARGGLPGRRFPWGDTISHDLANYFSDRKYFYDVSSTRGSHPATFDLVSPYSAPVGAFPPNNYGLHDMAGGMWEWCWDSFDRDFYANSPAKDPHGPGNWRTRVTRGGAWGWTAFEARCSFRRRGYDNSSDPSDSTDPLDPDNPSGWDDYNDHGLRVVRIR